MPIIPAGPEKRFGGSWFEASLGIKVIARPPSQPTVECGGMHL
jgi:hypothetical protein